VNIFFSHKQEKKKIELCLFIDIFNSLVLLLNCQLLQTVASWFEEFNDEQKNLLLLQLLVGGQFAYVPIILPAYILNVITVRSYKLAKYVCFKYAY